MPGDSDRLGRFATNHDAAPPDPPGVATTGQDMFDIHRKTITWAGRKLTLETGRIARQADAAVLATYGETTVLATVVSAKERRRGGFLPAHREYQKRPTLRAAFPAAISSAKGGLRKRKRWFSRLIDRPIRRFSSRAIATRRRSSAPC